MKRVLFFVVAAGLAAAAAAQDLIPVPEYDAVVGNWTFNKADNRLYQNDETAGLAKANIRVPQSGAMLYEFNIRYEGGLDDTHAGFGIHLFVDEVVRRPSWGSGRSYLLWLNYDEKPVSEEIPAGWSAQVYRSDSQSKMTLLESFDLNDFMSGLDPSVYYSKVPVRIIMDGDSGEVRIYDPFHEGEYYVLKVDPGILKKNAPWVTLRTNSMRASFGMGL